MNNDTALLEQMTALAATSALTQIAASIGDPQTGDGVDDMTWQNQAACKSRPDLFGHPVLDYKADDPDSLSPDQTDEIAILLGRPMDPAALTADDHTALAALKKQVEDEAVDHCFGCAVMLQCEAWALRTGLGYGVTGGLTEAERAERLTERGEQQTAAEQVKASYRDRGPRLQIDDAAVETFTKQGWNAERIARELGCHPRSVVRARARITARNTPTPETTPQETAVQETAAQETVVLEDAQPTAAPAPAPAPEPVRRVLDAGRTRRISTHGPKYLSPAMRAMYAVLADGAWHHRDDLIAVGIPQISDEDALDWWIRSNQVNTAQGKILNPSKMHVPTSERIAIGAREKAINMLSASARVGKRTERGGLTGRDLDTYRITAKGRALATAAQAPALFAPAALVAA